jgi:Ca2+-binding RTX toxin-like protein
MDRSAKNLWHSALIADAAYARHILARTSGVDLAATLSDRLPVPIARSITNPRAPLTALHQSSETYFDSGFSATIYDWNGKKYFAIRGTEEIFVDFRDLGIADPQIALIGIAKDQAVDLYRYWRMLTTPNGAAVAYSTQEVNLLFSLRQGAPFTQVDAPARASIRSLLAADRGLGVLSVNEKVTVVGHSLGGHLVQVFTQFFPWAVEQAYTFNGPGFGGVLAQIVDGFFPGSIDIQSSIVTNVVAKHGPDATAGLGIVIGDTLRIFNEKSLVPINNHFIDKLTDSLALYSLFSAIDPALQIESITDLLDASSNVASRSLETSIDSLREVMSGTPVAATSIGDRAALNQNVLSLLDRIAGSSTPAPLGIESLVRLAPATIAERAVAADGIAYRYSLDRLLPFAITGLDYSALGTAPSLDLADEGGSGSLTHEWVDDRAELLSWLDVRNVKDAGTALQRNDGGLPIDFIWTSADGSRETLRIRPPVLPSPFFSKQVFFGGGAADEFEGAQFLDRIYGGAGDDRLTGGAGGDHIEGGDGEDRLFGAGGDDTLIGGAGDDFIDGGAGHNVLEGGPGFDTYALSVQDGMVEISDSDGRGAIVLNGVALSGGTGSRNLFWNGDHSVYYTLSGGAGDERVLGINGVVDVVGFDGGMLGLNLVAVDSDTGPAAPPPQATRRYFNSPISDDEKALRDADPDYQFLFPLGSPENDTLIAGPDWYDYFLGRGGDDYLQGAEGAGLLIGGPGDDYIASATDSASLLLAGGPGNDRLLGSDQADILYGDFYSMELRSAPGAALMSFVMDEAVWQLALPGAIAEHPDGFASMSRSLFMGDRVVSPTWGYPPAGSEESFDTFLNYVLGVSLEDGPVVGFDDLLEGYAGDDILLGGAGSDVLLGGAGDDVLYGNYGRPRGSPWANLLEWRDVQAFGPQVAALFGAPGSDYLEGGEGNDFIFSETPHSNVLGGAGDDIISVFGLQFDEHDELLRIGSAIVDAGAGNDTVRVNSAWTSIDGGDEDDDIVASSLTAWMDGGRGADRMEVTALYASMEGGDGNDTYVIALNSYIWPRFVADYSDSREYVIADSSGEDTLVLPGPPELYWTARDGADLLVEFDFQYHALTLQNAMYNAATPEEAAPLWLRYDALFQLPPIRVTISDWFSAGTGKVETISFADAGVTWSAAEAQAAARPEGVPLDAAQAFDAAFDAGEPAQPDRDPGPFTGGDESAADVSAPAAPGALAESPAEPVPAALPEGRFSLSAGAVVPGTLPVAASAPAADAGISSEDFRPVRAPAEPQTSGSDWAEGRDEREHVIAAFFARNEPPRMTTQQWLDEWLPAGTRTAASEARLDATELPSPAESEPAESSPADGEDVAADEVARRYEEIDAWLARNNGCDTASAEALWAAGSVCPLSSTLLTDSGLFLQAMRFGATPGMAQLGGIAAQPLPGLREGLQTVG